MVRPTTSLPRTLDASRIGRRRCSRPPILSFSLGSSDPRLFCASHPGNFVLVPHSSEFTLRLIKALFLAALLATPLCAAPPADYYQATHQLTGAQLRKVLHDLVDDHTVIKYSKSRPAIAHLHQDPKNATNLIQIYTQKSVPKAKVDLWNREHLWPRSRGNTDKKGPDDSDLHHLFPSDYQVNNNRASLLYDLTKPPRLASFWSMDADSFQPPASVVGDIARALFYMAIRYDGSDRLTSNLTLVSSDFNGAEMGHLSVLLQWHAADPPDDFERRRNDLIYSTYQHNRNPFVDHPEFVTAIWGPPPALQGQ